MRKVYVSMRVGRDSLTAERKWWDDNWEKANSELSLDRIRREEYFDRLIDLINERRPERILEAVCGRGQWIKGLGELGFSVDGADFSNVALQIAKENCGGANLFQCDLRSIPVQSGCYDLVLSLGVIEHFEEGPGPVLREHGRILKSSGVLFAHVPFLNLNRRLNLVWRGFEYIRQSNRVRKLLGLRKAIFFEYMMTKKEICELFRGSGLEIVKGGPIYVWGGFDYDIPFFVKVGIVGKCLDRIRKFVDGHRKLFGPIFSHHYLVVCKKA